MFSDPKQELSQDNRIENYEFGKILGLGSYGVVKLAKHTKSGIYVAIKSYEKVKLQDYQKRKNVQREIRILSKLRHKNIVKLYNVIEGNKFYFILYRKKKHYLYIKYPLYF